MGGPRWTGEEDSLVRALYPTHGAAWDGWSRLLPGKGADAAYQRARKLGLVGGRAAPSGATGPWPAPAERRALAASLRRMVADGADMTDRDWVACRLSRETGVGAGAVRAWMEAERRRKR